MAAANRVGRSNSWPTSFTKSTRKSGASGCKKLWERYSIHYHRARRADRRGVGGWRGYEWWQAKQAADAGAEFEAAVDAERGRQARRGRGRVREGRRRSAGRLSRAGATCAPRPNSRRPRPTRRVKAFDALAADPLARRDLAGSRRHTRRPCCWSTRRRSPNAERGWCRSPSRPHLPPQRARIAGALGLAQSTTRPRAKHSST